jgi:polyisoprenoid-binding protein YceI
MNMRRLTAMAFVGVLATYGAAEAATYSVDPSHSEVSFQIRHLVGKVRGKFKEFSATVDDKTPSVEFKIKADSIDTGEPKRDGHLRSADFFDVEKYPEITFKSDKVTPKGKDEYEAQGTLTMHGVSKPLTLTVHVNGPQPDPWGKTRAGFETQTTLDRKQYGIVWNKALDNGGALLGDDVAVSINLETVQDAAAGAAPAPGAAKPDKPGTEKPADKPAAAASPAKK